MITGFRNNTAALTGTLSGFGVEYARIGSKLGMNLVPAHVQQDALEAAAMEMRAASVQVLAVQRDSSRTSDVEALAQAAQVCFGAFHAILNNAGNVAVGLNWENIAKTGSGYQSHIGNPIMPGLFDTPLMQSAAENGKAALAELMVTNSKFNGESARLDGAIRMVPR